MLYAINLGINEAMIIPLAKVKEPVKLQITIVLIHIEVISHVTYFCACSLKFFGILK